LVRIRRGATFESRADMSIEPLTNGFDKGDALPIPEITVQWMTAGLGCDGDTVAVTAATQPRIEDIVLAPFPGFPKHNF
jgi:hypothetical protein